MLRKLLFRSLAAIGIGLPLTFAIAAVSEAGVANPELHEGECQDCHEIIQSHWAESGHGSATDDPAFQEAWDASGRSPDCLACHTTGYDDALGTWQADGISCSTCHGPAPSNHPEQIMPTDVSSRLCGKCHLETYSEWTTSLHSQEDLACVRCHSPHTTGLKADDAQALCSACHTEEVHFYSYTSHYEAGLLCTDCHLRIEEGSPGKGHGQRSHTFSVDMDTCSNCHEDEMHYPLPQNTTAGNPPASPGSSGGGGIAASVEPAPVSPVGFAVLAALLGIALGLVLAPWSERWYRRIQ